MARIHGKNGSFQMATTTGGSPSSHNPVGDIRAFTIDMTKEKVVVTAFQDTNVQRVVGLPDFQGTLSGFWNSVNSPTLFDVVLGSTPVGLKLIPNILEPTYYFYGDAYLDGSLSVAVDGAVTFDGSWVAASNWTMAP